MSNYDDRLKDYVDVKERIRLFYEKHPDGRLITAEVRWPEPMDDMPRITVKAKAYRDPDDILPGIGWSWMVLPGSTSFTKGSELENTETSAWGRAIGALGIGIEKSIASQDEVDAKAGEETRVPAPEKTDDGGLIGVVEKGTARDSDLELRETPDGWVIGFRLKANGRGGIKVIARDAMAQAVAAWAGQIVGQRVTCWGRISDEEFTPKGTQKKVKYQVLQLERMQTPDFTLPAPEGPSSASGEVVQKVTPPDLGDSPSYHIPEGQEALPLDPEERAMIAGDLE
jgi:hypothetical protein